MEATVNLKSPWQLSFLSGPMMGRSMSLLLGENWVGSSAECDVILPDREVAPKHLRLHVGNIAVSVQNATDAAATLNGEALGMARRTVVPGDVVGAGSIRFGIQWASPAMAAMPEDEQAPERVRRGPHIAVPPALLRVKRRQWLVGLAVAWALLAVLAGGYYAVANYRSLRWANQSQFERIRLVQQALADYPELTVGPAADGHLVVSGYLPTASQQPRVQEIVSRFDGVSLGDIYDVDKMVAGAQQYFSDTSLKVNYGGRGKLVISGSATDDSSAAVAQRIKNFARDAAPAAHVVDEVQYKGNPMISIGSGAPLPEIVGVYQDENGTRFVQTSNGNHYFEGAQIRDGLQVVSIAPDTVVFSRGGQRIVWHIAGPSDSGMTQASAAPAAPAAALDAASAAVAASAAAAASAPQPGSSSAGP